ncbi:hypothetical protein AMJ40_01185 [candidate division TA06 bacterium DG_26]|uniref:DNA polymerase III subunit delta' n=1 Tax=candidate division TA06 bacterium DG_26 TaxID=1703771 RepID=A0A0S7WLE1_UNCT6|nr:MAG: hypothetical protein AMJ40_01185 [candidate division TA06 bacterium DG_26]
MFDNIVGQETAKKILANQIEKEKVSHAYLFHGQCGVGKTETAIAFAKALNCDRGSGCGTCTHCKRVERFVHPDVKFVFPVPSAIQADALVELYETGKESHFRFPFSQRASISIDTIRSVSGETYLKPYESRWKVNIVIDADKMTQEASNAFLKTLEEPPSHAIFILITEHPQSLPLTILSRCQSIRFRNLSREEIEQALKARGVEPSLTGVLARLASGSLGRALRSNKSEYMEIRRRLIDGFLALGKKRWETVIDLSQWLVDECDRWVFVEVFLSLYRDLLVLKEGLDTLVQNCDYISELRNRAEQCENERVAGSLKRLENFAAAFEININLKVAFPPLLSALC